MADLDEPEGTHRWVPPYRPVTPEYADGRARGFLQPPPKRLPAHVCAPPVDDSLVYVPNKPAAPNGQMWRCGCGRLWEAWYTSWRRPTLLNRWRYRHAESLPDGLLPGGQP